MGKRLFLQFEHFRFLEEKKQTVMETITIEYDKNNKAARSMVSALKQFDFLKVKKQRKPNKETQSDEEWASELLSDHGEEMNGSLKESLEDIAAGRVVEFDNLDKAFEYLKN